MGRYYNKQMAKNGKRVAYGEMHFDNGSVASIESAIKSQRPDVLFHELGYTGTFLTREALEKELDNVDKDGSVCYSDTNIDVFKLCIKLGIPLIGIDRATRDKKDTLSEWMVKREHAMVNVIRKHLERYNTAAVVVGDSHLRSLPFEDLPKSPLTSYLNNNGFTIVRARKDIRELE